MVVTAMGMSDELQPAGRVCSDDGGCAIARLISVEASRAVFVLPPSPCLEKTPCLASFQVGVNSLEFASLGLPFLYVEELAVHAVDPSTVPALTPMPVTVYGSGFVKELRDQVVCRFADSPTLPAIWVSESQLTC